MLDAFNNNLNLNKTGIPDPSVFSAMIAESYAHLTLNLSPSNRHHYSYTTNILSILYIQRGKRHLQACMEVTVDLGWAATVAVAVCTLEKKGDVADSLGQPKRLELILIICSNYCNKKKNKFKNLNLLGVKSTKKAQARGLRWGIIGF